MNQGRFLGKDQDLGIAGVRFVISRAPSLRLWAGNSLYLPFLKSTPGNGEKAKIAVSLRFDGFPPLDGLKKIYDTGESWSLHRDEKNFWICMAPPQHAEPFWIARFDHKVNRATVFCRSVLPGPGKKKAHLELPVMYPLDQLLLMHFLAWRRGILTHAAGVVSKGRSFIFTGASGAGKSTFSELLAEAGIGKLLSDERMIVREMAGTMRAFGTPWAGTAGIARSGDAPLAGIFFLKHAPGNHIEKLAPGDALDRLLPLLSVPWYDPDTLSRIIAFAKRLVARVPAYEMGFTPDRSAIDFFWKYIKIIS